MSDILKRIFADVKSQYYPFNDYLLKGYRKEQINKCADYLDVVFREAERLFNGEIKYLGYTVLSPEHRIEEINNDRVRRGFNIQISELQLVRFEFQYKDEIIYAPIYLPYMKNDSITIDDTIYFLQLAIVDKIIYRITNANGIIVKVMRSPLRFWRNEQIVYKTVKGRLVVEAVITTKIHNKEYKRGKKDIKPTLLLYPLAHYGYLETLKCFNILPEHLSFIDKFSPNETEEDFDYIKIRDNLFIKVHNSVFEDIIKSRVVASLLYVLRFYKNATVPGIYDETGVIWKIIIGKGTYGDIKDTLAHNHAEKHFASLATYLDPKTKEELAKQNVFCNDIYELLVAVFKNIDIWIRNYSPNNLYNKKIGVLELILCDLVETIFKRFYQSTNDRSLDIKMVHSILKIPIKRINGIHSCGAVRNYASVYGDNALLTILDKKVRQPISDSTNKKSKKKSNLIQDPDHHFDPSFIDVESILSNPSSNPGNSGDINPYAQIDENGCIIQPEWAKEDLSELKNYLPYR